MHRQKLYNCSYIPDTTFFLLIAMTDGSCNQENLFLSLTGSVCMVKGVTEQFMPQSDRKQRQGDRKPRTRYGSKDTPLVTYFFKLGPTFSSF